MHVRKILIHMSKINIVGDIILLLYLHHIYTHVNPIFRPVPIGNIAQLHEVRTELDHMIQL